MSTVRVNLLGKFGMQSDRGELGLETKLRELLAYLLIRRDRPHSREALAALIWGDCPTGQSRKCLRQALWQINSAVQEHLDGSAEPLLLAEPDWIQLNPGLDLWIDVAVLEEAAESARGRPGNQLPPDCAEALRRAAQVYRGDLLEGCYEDWCLFERERLQNLYLAMLDKLVQCCEAGQEYEAGLAYANRILSYDRAHERAHRQVMRLYYLAGDRSEALRQYRRCATALRAELDVEPSRATARLYEAIRADRLDARAPAGEAETRALPRVLAQLKQLHRLLGGVQSELERDIDAVEMTLDRWRC
ncbi:MAG: hypothetical protein GXY76_06605 [Chloroflexi bacterium]|nr:hypothetical protein [Chloroflexota bacterium]